MIIRMIISAVQGVAERALDHQKLDPTLARYVRSVIGVALTILLFIAMLSVFGVETTSFAGVLAAASTPAKLVVSTPKTLSIAMNKSIVSATPITERT